MKHFPDIGEIKLLEKNSQKNGSGIPYEELLGIWKFKYVWGKESDEIKNIPVSYTHLRAHETSQHLVCRLLL